MIIRIVKLTIMPEKVNDFLEIFHSSKDTIRNFEGCAHLELLNDIHSTNIFFTYSYWQSESDLNNYRDSDYFGKVWSRTKMLFASKTEAWSVEQRVVVE